MSNHEEDLENQVIYFKDSLEEEETAEAPARSGRLSRRGRGRPAHNPATLSKTSRKTNNKVEREIQKNVLAAKGHVDLAPWSQNAFTLPATAYERFKEAGYRVYFCPLEDNSLRMRENEGWRPVTRAEMPEWTVSSIPSLNSSYGDIYRNFIVCIDQILLKIEEDQYQYLKSFIDKERYFNQRIINKAEQNSINPTGLNQTNSIHLTKPR